MINLPGEYMNKQFADEMIEQFQTKFFGFALSKCRDLNEAEELAARITCEAYVTLRNMDEIYNWEGYLYKIASNVYAKYVKEQKKNKTKDIDGVEINDTYDFEADVSHKEELEQIKKEVAWLGKRHREIVILHYYHNKKLAEIAKQLDIPEGTVKWHLSDAKAQLKKGMSQVRRKGTLGIEPIELKGLGNMGKPGDLGDTSYFLNSKLRQNIAYAAYFEPKTKLEIAEELGVSPVYIEDEVDYLEEYGFLDLLAGQKYRTNIFITDVPGEAFHKSREIDKEIAIQICDLYVPKVLEYLEKSDRTNIYIPNDDWNFYLWSMIPMLVAENNMGSIDWDKLKQKNYLVKRKDGGEYVALATVYREDWLHDDFYHEMSCGPMYKIMSEDGANVASWCLSTDFDTREFGWVDHLGSDYSTLYMYLKGELPKTEGVLDKYIRLYDRGLLVNVNDQDKVNVIVKYMDNLEKDYVKVINNITLPASDELKENIEKLFQQKINLEKQYFPKHMHDMLEIYRRASNINVVMVIDELLERGVLKPLTEEQKKGVMNVVYADLLPVR